jgi:hypothetical protein
MTPGETARKAKELAAQLARLDTELTLQKLITQFDACVEAYEALRAYAAKQDEKIDRLSRTYDEWLCKQSDLDVDTLVAELEAICAVKLSVLSELEEEDAKTGGDRMPFKLQALSARHEMRRDIAFVRLNHPKK